MARINIMTMTTKELKAEYSGLLQYEVKTNDEKENIIFRLLSF